MSMPVHLAMSRVYPIRGNFRFRASWDSPFLFDIDQSIGGQWVDLSKAILRQMLDASCGPPAARAQHRGNLTPAVQPTQADLATHHEPEEQHQHRVLGG